MIKDIVTEALFSVLIAASVILAALYGPWWLIALAVIVMAAICVILPQERKGWGEMRRYLDRHDK